jgi:hypothetical protein
LPRTNKTSIHDPSSPRLVRSSSQQTHTTAATKRTFAQVRFFAVHISAQFVNYRMCVPHTRTVHSSRCNIALATVSPRSLFPFVHTVQAALRFDLSPSVSAKGGHQGGGVHGLLLVLCAVFALALLAARVLVVRCCGGSSVRRGVVVCGSSSGGVVVVVRHGHGRRRHRRSRGRGCETSDVSTTHGAATGKTTHRPWDCSGCRRSGRARQQATRCSRQRVTTARTCRSRSSFPARNRRQMRPRSRRERNKSKKKKKTTV